MTLAYIVTVFVVSSALWTSFYKDRETLSDIVFDFFTGWFYVSFILFRNLVVLIVESTIVFMNNTFTDVKLIYPSFFVPEMSRGNLAVGSLLSFFAIVNLYILAVVI